MKLARIVMATAALGLATGMFAADAHAGKHDGYHGKDTRDVVVDARGNVVHSTNGNCVYTKWDAGYDACGGCERTPVAKSKHDPKQKPAPVRSYLVFFDWDKATITSAAREVLQKVRNKAGGKSLSVTGHADRSGPADYNMGLSKRRAQAVRDALTRMGFENGKIRIDWKGERQPLIATGDGIREPQNRRVEIRVR